MAKSKDTDSTATLDFEGVERQPPRTFPEPAHLEKDLTLRRRRRLGVNLRVAHGTSSDAVSVSASVVAPLSGKMTMPRLPVTASS